MQWQKMSILIVGSCLFMASMSLGETVTCERIVGSSTTADVSADGRYAVGNKSTGGTYIYDTTSNTMTTLPALGMNAMAVSADGSVVVGDVPDPSGQGSNTAGVWTAATGWYSILQLPNAGACPSRSDGYDVSADGTFAVGLSWDGCSGRGFVWTEATDMLELEPLANGGNRASVVSADGTVIGGFAQGTYSRTPAVWNGVTTTGELLDPPNGDAEGEVMGMSDDGMILLGTLALGEPYYEAVKWTEAPDGWVPQRLGAGSVSPSMASTAVDMAGNGTIVGYDYLMGGGSAWIQPGGTGNLVSLWTYITSNGGTVPSGLSLAFCRAISSDGRIIVGHDGFMGSGWLVRITPDCPADVNGDGAVDVLDLLAVLASWGQAGGPEDINGDGIVDVLDLLETLSSWGPC